MLIHPGGRGSWKCWKTRARAGGHRPPLRLLPAKDAKFRPSILRDRGIIRNAMSEPNAAEDLRAAIADPHVDPKFRSQLETELAAMVPPGPSARL